MKFYTITSSFLIINTMFAMKNIPKITFINKNLPNVSIVFHLLNTNTRTQGNYPHFVKKGKEKTLNFSNIQTLKAPTLIIKKPIPINLTLKGIDYSGDIITITKNNTFITVTNKHNTIISCSSIINQPNSSGSGEN